MKKERREVVLPQNGRNKEENKGMLEERKFIWKLKKQGKECQNF